MQITKRNGNIVVYDDEKVVQSIMNANAEVPDELIPKFVAAGIAGEAFDRLTDDKEVLSTTDVRTGVYNLLCERGYPLTAEKYQASKDSKPKN